MPSTPPPAWFDHAVIAVPDLSAALTAWADEGLPPAIGGQHPGGTHNALIRSDERAYIELLAAHADATSPWAQRVREENGPMAWAVGVADLETACVALVAAGLPPGPIVDGSRSTPDGGRLQWRTCNLGPYPMHPHLPFLIEWQIGMPSGPEAGPRIRSVSIEVPDPELVGRGLAACGLRRVAEGIFDDGRCRVHLTRGGSGVTGLGIEGLRKAAELDHLLLSPVT